MRVSEYFGLERNQAFLDFVDVPLDTDLPVFVDPVAIRAQASVWSHECVALLQQYFRVVLEHMKAGREAEGLKLLESLHERNEFHLGYSKGRSRGHAFGVESAGSVWGALADTKAAVTGLLADLEDSCLLIPGIGRDMISDAVCNILRGPLVKYTQAMCHYYDITLTQDVDSGPIWNETTSSWEQSLVALPLARGAKLILVPKQIVRHRISYEYNSYYTHYLLPVMQDEELAANSGLVQVLKNGTRRVTKKSLRETYGNTKEAVIEQTLKRPTVLQDYKKDKERHPPLPITHTDLAKLEDLQNPDWSALISELKSIPVGMDHATQYENIIEKLLSALFYGNLAHPTKQAQLHDGRKRVDITYTNEAVDGFFKWLSAHYPSALIFVECKNYGQEIGNPEIDQLSGRFSPSRGKVGFVVCRSIAKPELLRKRCIDTAKDDRGYIVPLTDLDVEELVRSMIENQLIHRHYPLLRQKFEALIIA